jgi:hypothetical protein
MLLLEQVDWHIVGAAIRPQQPVLSAFPYSTNSVLSPLDSQSIRHLLSDESCYRIATALLQLL